MSTPGRPRVPVGADVDPHTAAWWLISLLAGRSFRTAVAPDGATMEAELTEPALRSLLPERH
ncbi:hypothetical protein [Streptomyces sannanensis]